MVANFFTDNPYLGYGGLLVILAAGFLNWLAQTSSSLEVLKSKLYKPLAHFIKFKKLEKAAIKADIQGNVNKVVDEMRKELPKGWAPPLLIKWVQKEDPESFIEDRKMVIRIRPRQNNHQNFINSVYFYFKEMFFPRSRTMLPATQLEATTLYFSRRVIKERKKEALKTFEDYILEPAVTKKSGIVNYIENFQKLDSRGLFTGILIREIEEIAGQSRFNRARNNIGSEFSSVIKHLESFIEEIDNTPRNLSSVNVWIRKGPTTSYAIILVARPESTKPSTYVNRAKIDIEEGAGKIYVFGKASQVHFAKQVVRAINKVLPEATLKESYKLHRDYRNNAGGIGALFVIKR